MTNKIYSNEIITLQIIHLNQLLTEQSKTTLQLQKSISTLIEICSRIEICNKFNSK